MPTWGLLAGPGQGYSQALDESTDQFDDGFRGVVSRAERYNMDLQGTISCHRTRLTAYLAVRRLRTWHFALLLLLGPF